MACFHGGAFWDAIGIDYRDLERRNGVVNADVLDAWFPPAPAVLKALTVDPGWMARTSPPTHAEGVRAAIADRSGIDAARVLVGPGSSALLFLAFSRWLRPGMRVLTVDPTYGEYAHAIGVAGANGERMMLEGPNFRLDLNRWIERLCGESYDLAVLVNPNNPTGQAIPAERLQKALVRIPSTTRVWIDEAYAPFATGTALDLSAFDRPNVFVVRSMSKGFALSGLRAAYLVGPQAAIQELGKWMPPWAVSLPAQVAVVAALSERDYYETRYAETEGMRRSLSDRLRNKGLRVLDGVANWVLAELPAGAPCAHAVCQRMAVERVFVRDAGRTAPALRDRYLRVAVRPDEEAERLLTALDRALAGEASQPASLR
ncbi:MAG: pyridoxal phosphate-dependent aminotransferase [Fimbriimonas sp.]